MKRCSSRWEGGLLGCQTRQLQLLLLVQAMMAALQRTGARPGLRGSTGKASVGSTSKACGGDCVGGKAHAGLVASLWGTSMHGLSCADMAVY